MKQLRGVDDFFAWIVTCFATVIGIILGGLSWSSGLMAKDMLNFFDASRSSIAWIQSAQNGIQFILGPVVGYLITKYSCRTVGMAGSVIIAVALLASSFAPSVPVLIALYGCVGGIGYAMLYMSSITVVGLYFVKRRALATCITCCGSSVGGILYAPFTSILIDRYTWKGAILIFSAVTLNGIALSAIFRPISFIENNQPGSSNTYGERTEDSNNTSNSKYFGGPITFTDVDHSNFLLTTIRLLKMPVFLCFAVSGFFGMFAFYIPLMFIPQFAHAHGLSSSQGSTLISVFSLSNTIARILIGTVVDRRIMDPISVYTYTAVGSGLLTLGIKYFTTFWLMAMYCTVTGIAGAAFITMRSVILANLFGRELLPHTFGLTVMFQGVAALIGPPIIGFARDSTGKFTYGFMLAGACTVLCGLVAAPLRRLRNKTDNPKTPTSIFFPISVTKLDVL